MIPFSRPYEVETPKVKDDLEDILLTGRYTKGPWVNELQERLAEKYNVPTSGVILTGSGTTALMSALWGFKRFKPWSSNVVVPEFTYKSVPIMAGMFFEKVMQSDVHIDDWCMRDDPSFRRTDLMIPMDTFGNRFYFNPEKFDGELIYDACQSFGAGWDVRGLAEVLSFNGGKIFTTGGEGGAVITENSIYSAHVKEYANLISRMTEFQALVGLYYLARIDDILWKKRNIYDYYRKNLRGFIEWQHSGITNHYIIGILTMRRDEIIEDFKRKIDFRYYYDIVPYGKNTKILVNNMLCLPNGTIGDVELVVEELRGRL